MAYIGITCTTLLEACANEIGPRKIRREPSGLRGDSESSHASCYCADHAPYVELLRSPKDLEVRKRSRQLRFADGLRVVDPNETQDNILYARALNSEVSTASQTHTVFANNRRQHQLELLNTLSQSFATNEYRLLIIDSIMNCFRVDYCGRGELADRQQKLNQFLSKLAHVAEG